MWKCLKGLENTLLGAFFAIVNTSRSFVASSIRDTSRGHTSAHVERLENVIESLPLNIFCSLDMKLQWNYVWPLFINIDHRVFFIRAMASNKMLVARAAEMLNLQSNCKERGIASICRLLAITLARIIRYKQSFTFFQSFGMRTQ